MNQTIPENEGRSAVRFRLFASQETDEHDARGDAVALVVEHLQPWYCGCIKGFGTREPIENVFFRGFSNSASYTLAYLFVNKCGEELKTSEVPFDENYCCAIDAFFWCAEVMYYLDINLDNLADNSDLLHVQSCWKCCLQRDGSDSWSEAHLHTSKRFTASMDCSPPLDLTVNGTHVIVFRNVSRQTQCLHFLYFIFGEGTVGRGVAMRYKDKVNSIIRRCQLTKIEAKKHLVMWSLQCAVDLSTEFD
ncbi:unnamed protein product [Thelazia callipaeda]|uniref:F-box protein n=1 Tax=Thelazia callipaeda TaxID=103827 RepID=A0A0N5D2X3_THECL|nr:unnamed protein product [Thelazia callipaeda]